jgi:hypothetical protein
MTVRPCSAVLLAIAAGGLGAAELAKETQLVDQRQVRLTNRAELTFEAREDADVKTRELWYARRGADGWAAWAKHGITFGRTNPIVWQPTEGHWKIAVRIEAINGLASPIPEVADAGDAEFIVDRTAPTVAISFPAAGAKLRGGERYEVTWSAADPHLHSTPITIQWLRDADAAPVVVAEHIANTGSFAWTTPRDMTANGRLRILAADKVLNVGQSEIDRLVIDSIAPSRNVLGPAISAARAVELQLAVRDAGPAGLSAIQLFYTTDEGATWNEGPRKTSEPFTSLAWTAPVDGRIGLNIVATDQAGNASRQPAGKDDILAHILVDTGAPVIAYGSPIGIRPAGARPEAPLPRAYKPGDQVAVPFTVTDANVASNAASVFYQVAPTAAWQPLGTGLNPAQPFSFTIPDVGSDTMRIKVVVVDVAGNSGEAISSETFRVINRVEKAPVKTNLD